jgi:hypothetical protein
LPFKCNLQRYSKVAAKVEKEQKKQRLKEEAREVGLYKLNPVAP